MSSEIAYTLFYTLLTICIIYPPIEFVSAGLTIPIMFSKVLGSEEEQFVRYHIKRSSLTLLVYSLLPLGYILGLLLFVVQENVRILTVSKVLYQAYRTCVLFQESLTELFERSIFWQIFTTTSIVIPLFALYCIKNWSSNDWTQHPIVCNLTKFSNNNSNWQTVASDINREYRR